MEGREMMHKCEMEQKRWKAVYTIETAILMGILLPALAGILWICILLYEKGVNTSGFAHNPAKRTKKRLPFYKQLVIIIKPPGTIPHGQFCKEDHVS